MEEDEDQGAIEAAPTSRAILNCHRCNSELEMGSDWQNVRFAEPLGNVHLCGSCARDVHTYALGTTPTITTLKTTIHELEARLSDTRDHVDFLKSDMHELLTFIGKKKRKKHKARISEIKADLDGAS